MIASSPERMTSRSPRRARICCVRCTVPCASLTADHRRQLAQPRDRLGQQIAAGARRHVVEDHRQRHRLGDRAEVQVQPLLRRPVVVGRDLQQAVGARLARRLGQRDRLGRRVRAGAGDHRHALLRRLRRRGAPPRRAPRASASPTRRWCRTERARRCRRRSAHSTSASSAASSTCPSRIGVTSAVIAPTNMGADAITSRQPLAADQA